MAVITQSVILPASAEVLFSMYLDASKHEAITGLPVTIGHSSGDEFSAFGGALTGEILAVVEPTLIVQSWRSTDFTGDDPDSTLILSFSSQGEAGRIDLVHVQVPQHDRDAVNKGWHKHYWEPWRAYLGTANN